MNRSLVLAALAAAEILSLAACSTDNPIVDPPGGTDPADTLIVAAVLEINNNSDYTASPSVVLSVSADGADSVLVFNEDMDSGTWFALYNGDLTIPEWDIGNVEGPHSIYAHFRKPDFVDSESIEASIILDMTPPNVLPTVVFPLDGAFLVPEDANLRWLTAEDEWCPSGELTYFVLLDSSEPATQQYWTGRSRNVMLPELGTFQTWHWKIEVEDKAGNRSSSINGAFTTGSLDLPEFVLVPNGSFVMGSPPSEPARGAKETQFNATISRSFYFGSTNITIGQYLELVRWAADQGLVLITEDGVFDNVDNSGVMLIDFNNISIFDYVPDGGIDTSWSHDRWCESVNWYGLAALCDWLNLKSRLNVLYDRTNGWVCNDGDVYGAVGFRMPTEAEWEYSCRAGTTTAFANGGIGGSDCFDGVLNEIGWYCGNHGFNTFLPAQKIPNPWGIYDMNGGYSDWCYDRWADYPVGNALDPVSFTEGLGRIVRSRGSYPGHSSDCRSAARGAWPAVETFAQTSLRLVLGYGGVPE